MTQGKPNMEERFLLNRLRDILLKEDREDLSSFRKELEEPERLKKHVEPLIQEELEAFKNNFPNEYRQVVEKIISNKLKTSQKEMLDVIYPVLGRMIRKYIQLQFQQFRESIERQVRAQLTTGILGRIRYALFGLSKKEKAAIILAENQPIVEEIYVIEQHSGILIGSASRGGIIDIEMIAGMLTAIKAFVQDAFQKESEELELIKYETYSLVIQNHYSYYIATAISGPITSEANQNIRDLIAHFAETELLACLNQDEKAKNKVIKQKLEAHFFKGGKTLEVEKRKKLAQ